MHYNYCTLFDKNYINNGLALCHSLQQCADYYTLYIFAFDDITYDILNKLQLNNVIVLREQILLNSRLIEIKKNRSRAEYCWTCTAIIIEYVLETYDCSNCTYIDSDIYFFSNPKVLINEMLEAEASVLITPHYFKESFRTKVIQTLYGKYCVQFNTFMNDKKGRLLLSEWKEQCLNICSINGINGTYGDQKYQDGWIEKYDFVHELENRGGGLAPWNIGQFRGHDIQNNKITIENNESKKKYELIFYHFQGLKIKDFNHIEIGVHIWSGNNVDEKLVDYLYNRYILDYCGCENEIKDNKTENYLQIFSAKKTNKKEKSFIFRLLQRIEWIVNSYYKVLYSKLDDFTVNTSLEGKL